MLHLTVNGFCVPGPDEPNVSSTHRDLLSAQAGELEDAVEKAKMAIHGTNGARALRSHRERVAQNLEERRQRLDEEVKAAEQRRDGTLATALLASSLFDHNAERAARLMSDRRTLLQKR